MKRLQTREILAGVLLAALACRGDPTSSLRGGAKLIDLSTNVMFIDAGATKTLKVVVRDEQLNPLSADVTVASGNAAVVSVAVDTAVPVANGTTHSFLVTAVAPGHTALTIQGGGLSDSVAVSVLPVTFGGLLSTTSPKGGDTIRIASTAILKFDPATSAVTFPGGLATRLVSVTADTIKVLAPFGLASAIGVSNVVVTYVPGLRVTLNTAAAVTQTGDLYGVADTGYTTARTIALPTQTGKSTIFLTDMIATSNDPDCGEGIASGAVGKCAIFKYVANGTDSLRFQADWDGPATSAGGTDIDVYSCGTAGVSACFEDGGAGATSAKPEKFVLKPTAGTHYLLIELFATPATANIYVTITKLN
ncbi:MAG TPA: hypothetical protein VF923_07490 [Gemmatimonadales bacterium]